MSPSGKTTAFGAAAVVALFTVFAAALWATDALVFTGTDPSAKIVSGVLAMIGSFVAAVVTVVGLVLKHSIDLRSEARHEEEMIRAAILQREAEDRLKLEAAIEAVKLLSRPDGSPSLPILRAGALMTLSSLGHHSLTLALTTELLESGTLEATTVSHILDRALRYDDFVTQADALSLLDNFASKFVTISGYELPAVVLAPPDNLPTFVRRGMVIAIAKVMLARPASEWVGQHLASLTALVATICLAWKNETYENARSDAAAILRELIPVLPHHGDVPHPKDVVNLADILNTVHDAQAVNNAAIAVVNRLARWRDEGAA